MRERLKSEVDALRSEISELMKPVRENLGRLEPERPVAQRVEARDQAGDITAHRGIEAIWRSKRIRAGVGRDIAATVAQVEEVPVRTAVARAQLPI